MIRVCVLDDWDGLAATSAAIERLREHADVDVLGACEESELVERAGRAEVVIPIRERRRIDAALLDRLPRLEHIAQTGGGAAHIDMSAANDRGITVSLTKGASAASVAELALALTTAARRGLVSAVTSLRDGRWERPLGEQLAGSVFGVAGFGATGQAVARLAQAFGTTVLVYSRRARDGQIDGFDACDLDELCARSDAVSLHLELSPQTEGTMTARQLRAIGPAGLLVNTARAGLVVRADLLATLRSGELGGAALDVFHDEPPDPADPLLRLPSVLATPHLGWRTGAVLENYLNGAVDNVLAWQRSRK